jgi:DNA-binding beta-propeller fold protein YncE
MFRKMFDGLLFILSVFTLNSCVSEYESNVRMDGPTIAIVGPDQNLYVGDGYYNSRIVVYDLAGRFLYSWGSKGYGKGQLQNPHGLAFDNEGRLLVADRDNGRIQLFGKAGKYLSEWHSKELGRPWSLDIDEYGFIYSIDGGDQDEDNPRSGIVKLSATGELICRFSSFGTEPSELNWGHSIAVSDNGDRVFAVDLKNARVQKFFSSNQSKDNYNVDLDWADGSFKSDKAPLGIAYKNEILYVTLDGKGEPILLLNANNGQLNNKIGSGIFERAHGIFVDEENSIWVTDVDANKIFKLNSAGDVLLIIDGQIL